MNDKLNKLIDDFGSKLLNEAVTDFLTRNDGNGYHRIKALINTSKELGETDIQIANTIKNLKF